MDPTHPIPDADEALLARFAELDAQLGERLHARTMAAEESEEAERCERGFHRCARSLRQTLALKARLRDGRVREARENPPPPPPRDPERAARRKDAIRQGVRRVIFSEQEGEAADYLCDLLEERLETPEYGIGFEPESLDEAIAALCDDFGLDAEVAADWRNLPDPEADTPSAADGAEPDGEPDTALEWQGSG